MALRKYDFQSVKDRLLTRLKSKVDQNDPKYKAWKDQLESSSGTVFVELMAAGIEHLGYYLERRVLEDYMLTAQLQSSVYNLGAQLGYVPRRRMSAYGQAKVVFNGLRTEYAFLPKGSILDVATNLSTLQDYQVPPGISAIGTGDGATTDFVGYLSPIDEGTLKIYVAGTEVATDDGNGVINGTGITGTVIYEDGTVYLYFDTPPAMGAAITSDYNQSFVIALYQGVLKTHDILKNNDETLTTTIKAYTALDPEYTNTTDVSLVGKYSFTELREAYNNVADNYIKLFSINTQTSQSIEYLLATSGPPHYRATDRVYFPRYSWVEKLRFYYGDSEYGRNPFDDGNLIRIEYLVTDGAEGGSTAEFEAHFQNDALITTGGSAISVSDYVVKAGAIANGLEAEDTERVRTNAIHLYSTGNRAVTKRDYKFFIESYPNVGRAAIDTEEDRNPPNLRMRNTVKFSAITLDGRDIDDSITWGAATVAEYPPLSGTYLKLTDPTKDFDVLGVQEDDVVVLFRNDYLVDQVDPGDPTSLILKSGPDAAIVSPEFYHATRQGPPRTSLNIINWLKDYRTITVFREFEPPILLDIDLDIQIDLTPGYVPSTVLQNIQDFLLNMFTPRYFDFGQEIPKSAFWDEVTDLEGVQTATISWTIGGTLIPEDYFQPTGDDAWKTLCILKSVNAVVRAS